MANTFVVKAALWRYTDRDGSRRIARFGDDVELTSAEAKRGREAGVFDPAPVPAVVSEAVERALADIVTRAPGPIVVGDDGDLPLHHDVTAPATADAVTEAAALEAAGTGDTAIAVQDPAVSQTPQDAADAVVGTGDTTDTVPAVPAPKRPAKAASVDVWRDYIAAVKPELADKVAGLGKDELQAQAPKEG